MRLVLLMSVLVLASSCGPQCEQVTPTVTSVCRLPTDSEIQAGTSFTIRALPSVNVGSCQVTVNGSQLSLSVSATVCSTGGASARPVPPGPVACVVPALDAGTYTVSGTSQSFSVPSTGGTLLPACP